MNYSQASSLNYQDSLTKTDYLGLAYAHNGSEWTLKRRYSNDIPRTLEQRQDKTIRRNVEEGPRRPETHYHTNLNQWLDENYTPNSKYTPHRTPKQYPQDRLHQWLKPGPGIWT